MAVTGPAAAQAVPPFFQLNVVATPSKGVITESLGKVEFTYSIRFTYDASNPTANQFSINVTVEPITTVAPQGWQLSSPVPRQVTMKPSDTRTVTLAAQLMNDRPAQDAFDIEVRFRSEPFVSNPTPLPGTIPSQLNQGDSETVKVGVEKRLTFGESVTGFVRDYWPFIGIGALALLLLGVVLARGRRRPGGRVPLTCEAPNQPVVPGRSASFALRLANESRDAETVQLAITGVPRGWTATLPMDELELGPEESTQLWLTLGAPSTARAGDRASVEIAATPAGQPERRARLRLEADVVDSYGGGSAVEEEEEPEPSRRRRAARA